MQCWISGKCITLEQPITLKALFKKEKINLKLCAVVVNQQIVPTEQLAHCEVKPEDKIEFIRAFSGG